MRRPGPFWETFHASLIAHYPLRLFRGCEIGLKDALRRHRVERQLEPRPARAGGTQRMLGIVGGEVLVDQLHGQPEAPVQALGEAAREAADGMLAAILSRGQPHDHQDGAPFRRQLLDRGEARAVVRGGDGGQRVRQPCLEVADRDADALRAEVECQDRSGPGERREA